MGKKRRVLKWLAGAILLVVVLLAGLFFYINNGAFINRHVLPRVSTMLDRPVTAESIDFSLFRELHLHNLRIGGEDAPMVEAGEVHVRWRLREIIGGTLTLDRLLAKDVTVRTSTEEVQELMAKFPPSEPAEEAAQLNITNVSIENFNANYRHQAISLKVEDFHVTIDQLRNGAPFAATVGGALFVARGDQRLGAPAIELQADGALSQELLPTKLQASSTIPLAGQVAGVELENRRIVFEASIAQDGARSVIEKLMLRAMHGDATEASLAVDGSFNPQSLAADAKVSIELPSASMLNVIGGLAGGLSFGDTTLTYTGDMQSTDNAEDLSLNGDLQVRNFIVKADGQAAPGIQPLDMIGKHQIAIRQSTRELEIGALSLDVREQGRTLVSVDLEQPLTLSLADAEGATVSQASTLTVQVQELTLGRFAPLLPADSPLDLSNAVANTTYSIAITSNGQIVIDGTQRLDNLRTQMADTPPLNVTQTVQATASLGAAAVSATVSSFSLEVKDASRTWLSATLDKPVTTQVPFEGIPSVSDTTITVAGQGFDLRLLTAVSPGVQIREGTGTFTVTTTITDMGNSVAVNGTLTVEQLDKEVAGLRWRDVTGRQELRASFQNLLNSAPITGSATLTAFAGQGSAEPTQMARISLSDLSVAPDISTAQATINLEQLDIGAVARMLPAELQVPALGSPTASLRTTINKHGETITLSGNFNLRELKATLPGGASAPMLSLTTDYAMDFRADAMALEIKSFTAELLENEQAAISVLLQHPATISLAADAPLPILPIRATLRELDLASYRPLLPGIESLAGSIAGRLETRPGKTGELLVVEGSMELNNLQFATPTLSLTSPITSHSQLNAALTDDHMLVLRDTRTSLKTGNGLELVATLDADLDTTTQARRSTISANVPTPIDIRKWQAIVKTEDGTSTESGPAEPQEPGEGTKLPTDRWIVAELTATKFIYGALVAENPTLKAELKDGKLTVDDSGLNLNGARLDFGAMLDTQPDAPPFGVNLQAANLPLDPFIKTFAGALPVTINGSIKELNTDLDGQGFTAAALRQALNGEAVFELDSLEIRQAEGIAGLAFQTLVLDQFGLSMSDMRFNAGGGKASIKNGVISTPGIAISGGDLRFVWDGTVSFRGDSWVPDLTLVPAFRGETAQRLLAKKIKLTEADDGYYVAPALEIEGSDFSTVRLASMGLQYGAKIGRLDPNVGAAAGVLDLLKGGNKEEATPEQKQKRQQDAVNSVLNLLGGDKKKQTEQKSEEQKTEQQAQPTETEAEANEEPKKEKSDLEKAIDKSPLRGLFGN